MLSDEEIAGDERARQIADAAEPFVVAVAFAGEDRVQRVVEVVAPLRVETEAECFARRDHAWIV